MKKQLLILLPLLLIAAFTFYLSRETTNTPPVEASSSPMVYADHPPRPKSPDLPKSSGAAQSLDRWWSSRAYPHDRMPQEKWAAATEQHISDVEATAKTQSTQWETMGPHNIGGRTLTLEFNPMNPNTIYLGSACGGLWVSHTAGAGVVGWERVPTGFPILGVGAIAINPQDTNEIYIGTGEVYNYQRTGDRVGIRTTRGSYGIGILKSTDGGASWTKSLDWQYDELKGVQDLHIHPNNPNQLLAATSEGIYKTVDGGANWTLEHSVLMANDFVQHPNDTETLYAGVGNMGTPGGGIYKTTDFGDTWTSASNGLPANFTGKITLAMTSDAPYFIYASVADSTTGYGLYRSTDAGLSWSNHNSTNYATYQGWYSHDVAISPWNRDFVVCVGVNAYRSLDGGFSLGQVSYWYNWFLNFTPPIGGQGGLDDYVHADIHQVLFHPTDSNAVFFATDGGVFASFDGGLTFKDRNGSLQTTQFYANTSSSHQDSSLYIGGMQDNATAVYQGNLGWYRVIGGDGCNAAIRPDDDNIIFGSYQYLGMMFSTDRGASFNPVQAMPQSSPPTTAFVAPFIISEANPDWMYAGRSTVERSTDGGNSWSLTNGGIPLNGNAVLKIVGDPNDQGIVVASTIPLYNQRAKLYRSINGGGTWGDITGSLPDRYYNDIAINPNNTNEIYVAVSGFGTPHLYKTTNAGMTWTAMGTTLPDVPHNNLVIDPLSPDHMYIANDLGVYCSTDGGVTWAPFGTGLPEAVLAIDLDISPTNRKLRVATHGSGVYQAPLLSPSTSVSHPIPVDLEVALYPNPAQDHAQLRLTASRNTSFAVSITDMQGRKTTVVPQRHYVLGEHQIELPVENLAAGVYFVSLEVEDRQVTRKLIIQE